MEQSTPAQIAALLEKMEREEDVKRVVRLVHMPGTDRFRYLIETPFLTFPQAVIGTTDAVFEDVRPGVKSSSVRAAEELWKERFGD